MKRNIFSTALITAAAAAMLAAAPAGADSLTHGQAAQDRLASAERALVRGDAEDALAFLEAARGAARLDGDIARIESLNCRAFYALGQYEAAEAACSVAIDTRAAHWSDYNNRGATRMLIGNLDGAIADLQQANKLRRGVSAVRRNLARATALRAQRQAMALN